MGAFEIPVREYMSSPVRTVREDASLSEVDFLLHDGGFSAVAVTNAEGQLVGVLSRTDLLHAGEYGHDRALTLPKKPVSEAMTTPVQSLDADAPLAEAAKLMVTNRIHRVLITKNGDLVGLCSTRDLMRAVAEQGTKTPISELASHSLITVAATDTLALAIDRLDKAHKQALVVVDLGWPVGVFDQGDALAARGLKPEVTVDEAMHLEILVLPSTLSVARAAAQALAMGVRRVLVQCDNPADGQIGVVSGLDFAKLIAH